LSEPAVKIAGICAGASVLAMVVSAGIAWASRRRFRDCLAKTVIYMVLVLYLAIVTVPLLWVFYTSVKPTVEIYANPFGIPKALTHRDAESIAQLKENYENAWVKSQFSEFFFSSVKVGTISLLAVLVLSSTAAYVLARFPFFGSRALYFYFLSGLMVPMQLVLVPLFFGYTYASEFLTAICRPIFHVFGQGDVTVSLHDSHTGLILIYVAVSLPFTIFILTSFFKTLPGQLREAAIIDGCSEIGAFWHLMLPLAKPGLVTVSIFNFIGMWNEYLFALVFIQTEKLKTLPLGLASVSIVAQYKSDFGLMFAGLVIAMVPTIAVYLILQERLTRGITMGALKG
jgi:N-acetylglucosamine transport system permease protein